MRVAPTRTTQPTGFCDHGLAGNALWREHSLEYGLNCRGCEHITSPMSLIPKITDRPALLRNRARAKSAPASFLHDEAIAELQDRLTLVNRSFTDITIVTGHPDVWASAFPSARIIPDEETLALEPHSMDLVIHAMCLHWANDPIGQIIQCRRSLRPDGLFLSVAFGGKTLTELRESLGAAEIAVNGGLSPRVAPMAEIRDMGALLQRGGLALPVADSVPINVAYRDIFHLMHDLRAMGEANALLERHKTPPRRALFKHAQSHYANTYKTETDRIAATFELVFLLGWAPSDTQQKPLRPGSASHSLAAALGTTENPLKD